MTVTTDDTLRIVIMSRKRSLMAQRTQQLLLNSAMCVAESEVDDYKDAGCVDIISHPDDVTGIGAIRQWILDNIPNEIIFIADDDILKLRCNMGITGYFIEEPEKIYSIIANTANVAYDIGVHIFGFAQSEDVRRYNPTKPFTMCSWVGGGIGFIGRRKYRYSSNRLRADIDYCLTSMLHDRIIFLDSRYALLQDKFGLSGGNSKYRSKQRDKGEIIYLLQKWGKYLRVQTTVRNTLKIKVKVDRTMRTRYV